MAHTCAARVSFDGTVCGFAEHPQVGSCVMEPTHVMHVFAVSFADAPFVLEFASGGVADGPPFLLLLGALVVGVFFVVVSIHGA